MFMEMGDILPIIGGTNYKSYMKWERLIQTYNSITPKTIKWKWQMKHIHNHAMKMRN